MSMPVFFSLFLMLLRLKQVDLFQSVFFFVPISSWLTVERSGFECALDLLFVGFDDGAGNVESLAFLSTELPDDFLLFTSGLIGWVGSVHGILNLASSFS